MKRFALIIPLLALGGCQVISDQTATDISHSAQAIDSAAAGPAVTAGQVAVIRANAQAIGKAVGVPFTADPGVTPAAGAKP